MSVPRPTLLRLVAAKARRAAALMRKETYQLFRDPSTIAIGVVMPVMLVVLFGYGLSLDVKNVAIAIVQQDVGRDGRELAARFQLSPYFTPQFVTSMHEAEELMIEHAVTGVLRVPEDFSRRVSSGATADIQFLVNGTEANTARIVEGYARGTVDQWRAARADEGRPTADVGVSVERRMWFNVDNNSRHFLVPGLIVLVMTLLGAFMTALVMAREWERGTFEALFVSPARTDEILIGKTVPYFVLGLLGLMLCVAGAKLLFGVPLRGSVLVLIAVSAIYLLVTLSIGLVISALTKSQFVASQLALIATFLPALMLSGFLFDLNSMPRIIQLITYVLPARYYVALLQTLFLAGDVWSVVLRNAGVLAVMAVVMMYFAKVATKKQLA